MVSEEEVEAAWSLLRRFWSYDRELVRAALEAAAKVRESKAAALTGKDKSE